MHLQTPIPPELFTVFNDVTFHDEPHKYYVDNKEFISVTTLIHKYQEDFNEQYWSEIKANQYKVKPKDIVRAWRFINKKGTIKGSAIHDYAENLFLNKKYEYPLDLILNEFGFDPIYDEYVKTKQHVDKFYQDSFNKLIPIKTELVVRDLETKIAGMMDILFYNVRMNEYQIWDYKTNKNFAYDCSERHLLHDLYLLEDCDLELYSLQLGLYKYIIEKNTNIKLGKSYLVWFSHNNDNYKIIETKNREMYINKIIENRLSEING